MDLNPRQSRYVPDESDEEQIKRWSLPDVTEEDGEDETNPFGFSPTRPSRVTDEEPELEVHPLTAEELEAIRAAAHDEGFAEGKAAGFEQGRHEGMRQGFDEGRDAGHAEGLTQGLAEGKTRVDHAVAGWEQLARQLEAPLQQVDRAVEAQLVNLVADLTRAVIRAELMINPDVIHALIHEAVSVLPLNTPRVLLTLNPQDRAHVAERYTESELTERGWTLRSDAALKPGDCQVQTDTSHVEIRSQQRVNELLERFLHQQVTRVAAAPAVAPTTPAEVDDAAQQPPADPTV